MRIAALKLLPLIKLECLKLVRSFSCWGMLAGCLLIAALIFKWQLSAYSAQSHLALEQQGRVFGVSTEVIRPYWGWCMLLLALITPILNLFLIQLERQQKSFGFWVTYRVKAVALVLSKMVTSSLAIAFFTLALITIPLSLWFIAPIDIGLTLSGAVTVLLVSLWLSSMSVWLSFTIRSPALYLLVTYAAVALLSFIPAYLQLPLLGWNSAEVSFLSHAHHMMFGRLYMTDITYFSICILTFTLLSVIAAKRSLTQSEIYFK